MTLFCLNSSFEKRKEMKFSAENWTNELSLSSRCYCVPEGKRKALADITHSSWIISETRACYWRFILKRFKHNWIQNRYSGMTPCSLYFMLLYSLSVRMLFSLCHSLVIWPDTPSIVLPLSAQHTDMTAITKNLSDSSFDKKRKINEFPSCLKVIWFPHSIWFGWLFYCSLISPEKHLPEISWIQATGYKDECEHQFK